MFNSFVKSTVVEFDGNPKDFDHITVQIKPKNPQWIYLRIGDNGQVMEEISKDGLENLIAALCEVWEAME